MFHILLSGDSQGSMECIYVCMYVCSMNDVNTLIKFLLGFHVLLMERFVNNVIGVSGLKNGIRIRNKH